MRRSSHWGPRLYPVPDVYDVPSTDELMIVPEMASVHLLHQAVRVAVRGLRLAGEAAPRRRATQALAAGIVALLHALDALLTDYREACFDDLQAIAERDQNDDDLPL